VNQAGVARKPSWLKVQAPGGPNYTRLKGLVRTLNLHTVCEEAQCPNMGECWGGGTLTLMLMGELCTRGCRFCAVKAGRPTLPPDPNEPANVAKTLAELGLEYVVLTSVDRDDLPDGGAGHFAATVRAVKAACPDLLVETLIPDFQGDEAALRAVSDAGPDVLAHNVETVERLQGHVRDHRATWAQSIRVLRFLRDLRPERPTKTSIMLGLGETDEEVLTAMREVREAGVEFLTLGQYLRPSTWHLEVHEFVTPERFKGLERQGREMGFRYVAAGPLVRSSYRAGEFYIKTLLRERAGELHE